MSALAHTPHTAEAPREPRPQHRPTAVPPQSHHTREPGAWIAYGDIPARRSDRRLPTLSEYDATGSDRQ